MGTMPDVSWSLTMFSASPASIAVSSAGLGAGLGEGAAGLAEAEAGPGAGEAGACPGAPLPVLAAATARGDPTGAEAGAEGRFSAWAWLLGEVSKDDMVVVVVVVESVCIWVSVS